MNIYSSNRYWSAYKDYDYITILNKVEEIYNSYKLRKSLNQNTLKLPNSKKSDKNEENQN